VNQAYDFIENFKKMRKSELFTHNTCLKISDLVNFHQRLQDIGQNPKISLNYDFKFFIFASICILMI